MNVSITPELEKFVQKQVKSGMYNSASEVIREALRLLVAREEIRRQRIEGGPINLKIDASTREFLEGEL